MIGSLSPAAAGLQSLAVAICLLILGYLVAETATSRRLDTVTTWGLAFPGLIAFSLALMLVHILTAGWLFHSAWAVRVMVGISAIGLVAFRILRRRRRGAPVAGARTIELVALGSLVFAAIAVWGWPVFRMLPVNWANDIDVIHHMGWTSELINGETLPSGPLSGSIPNFYPWLYHGFLAMTTQFEPTRRAFVSLDAAQLLQVGGSVAGLFALGRQMTGRWVTGAAATVVGALSGGFGFLWSGIPNLIFGSALRHATVGTYLGDFLYRRSYHLAFQNLAPPLPRDVSYTLIPAFLLLVLMGVRDRNPRWLWAAGVVFGMEGLIGAEAFVVALVATTILIIAPGTLPRRRVAPALLVPGLSLWALWVVPLFLNYGRFGGFRDLLSAPVSLPAWDIAGGWGIAVPLAVVGAVAHVRRWRDPPIRIALLALAAAAIPMVASVVLPHMPGFSTLERDQRYWPLFFIGVALFAALGVTVLADKAVAKRAGPRRRGLAVGLGVVIMGFALPSPILASVAFVRERIPEPLVSAQLQRGGTLLEAIGAERAPLVVAVPDDVQEAVAAYTGYRLVAFGHVKRQVRWRRILPHIGGAGGRIAANQSLTSGSISAARFRRLVDKYDVDVVVAHDAGPLETYPYCVVRPGRPPGLVVVFVHRSRPCAG